jgi:hypothetical protein
MEREPRRKLGSVVVSALAVIHEIETFAFLIGARPQSDQHPDNAE